MVLAKSEDIAPLGKALDFELGIFDFEPKGFINYYVFLEY